MLLYPCRQEKLDQRVSQMLWRVQRGHAYKVLYAQLLTEQLHIVIISWNGTS